MTPEYKQEVTRLWRILRVRTGRISWAGEGLCQALKEPKDNFGPPQEDTPASLWWWMIESATHMNPWWFERVPLPQRECILQFIRKATGYTPPR